MTFAASYVNGEFLEGVLAQTINPVWSSDAIMVALHTDAITGQNANNQESWSTSGEVSSTGYNTKGLALTSPSFTASANKVIFKEADLTMSWGVAYTGSNVTFIAQGLVVFDDTLTTPYADPVICALNFGAPKEVIAGTFTITWDTNGIFYLAY